MKPDIMLSISLLVSNRMDTIEKCMESLQSLVKAVPTEIIAVDTGSTDGSIDVVKRYTDKIVEFTWCDDFAAARNAGLKEAKGEWFLFLDDDEWFEDTKEIIHFLTSGEEKRYASLSYEVRNYRSFEDTTIYEPAAASRMSRRSKELKFVGKVHEYLDPLYGPVKYVRDFVHHYGYVFVDQEKRDKHFKRNMDLLLEEQKKDPENCKIVLQIAQEYIFIKNWEAADKTIDEGILLCQKQEEKHYITWMIPTKARMYSEMGKLDEIERYVKEWEESPILTDLSRAALYTHIIESACNREKDSMGITYAKEYMKLRNLLYKNEEKMRAQAVLGLLQYVDMDHYTSAQAMLILMLIREKRWEEAWKQIKKINWEIGTENLQKIMTFIYGLADKNDTFGQLKEVINEILKCEKLEQKLYEITEKAKSVLPNRWIQIVDLFVGVRKESAYVLMQKFLSAQNHQNRQDMELYFNRYLKLPPEERVYYADFLWLTICEGLDAHELIEELDLDHWESAVAVMKDFIPCDQIEEFVNKLEGQMNSKDIKFLYARMVLFGKRLEEEENYNSDFEEFLSARCEYLKMVAEAIKEDKIIEDKQRALEILRQAMERAQAGEMREGKELIKEAIRFDPEVEQTALIFLERIMSALKEEQGKKAVRTNPEFIYLANQLKGSIRVLLADGKKEEALEMVKGLKDMVQGDEEVEELFQECVE